MADDDYTFNCGGFEIISGSGATRRERATAIDFIGIAVCNDSTVFNYMTARLLK